MHCNINERGRSVRVSLGVAALLFALALAAAAWWAGGWWIMAPAAAVAGIGGFLIYEGKRGWCVIRALGFRTRL